MALARTSRNLDESNEQQHSFARQADGGQGTRNGQQPKAQTPPNHPTHPRMVPKPPLQQLSGAEYATGSTGGSSVHATDKKLDYAKRDLHEIESAISRILAGPEIHSDELIALFSDIKFLQRQGHLERLRDASSNPFNTLSKRLNVLLSRLAADIAAREFELDHLEAADIHTIFNGLSVIVGESPWDALLADGDLSQLGAPLRKITESLLAHVRDHDIERKHWNNSQLINALNWVSRGLKRQVLSADTAVVKKFFTEALYVMKDWAPSSDDSASAATLVAPLDTRQLGKCMVQVATAMKFELIDTDDPATLLHDVVLGLCGGSALDECTQWTLVADGNRRKKRVLTPTLPDGIELANIGNTIKDCLLAGILSLDDPQVQSIIRKQCVQILRVSKENLLAREGQRLGNFCNFLRMVFEVSQATAQTVRTYRKEYDRLCAKLLLEVPVQVAQLSQADRLQQTVANLFSFVKAMDRTHSHSPDALENAASSLVALLPAITGTMDTVDSIAATLGGLLHFAMRGLTPRRVAADLMISLIGKLQPKDLAGWPQLSRALLMRAVVYCRDDLSAPESALDLQWHWLAIMQALLDLPDEVIDRLPYLEAALVHMRQDEHWLVQHRLAVGKLMPEIPVSDLNLTAIQTAVAGLQAREHDKEKALQSIAPARSGTATEPVQLPRNATTATPPQPAFGEQTPLAERSSAPNSASGKIKPLPPSGKKPTPELAAAAAAAGVNSPSPATGGAPTYRRPAQVDPVRTVTSIAAATSPRSIAHANDWQAAKRVTKARIEDTPALTSTEPALRTTPKPKNPEHKAQSASSHTVSSARATSNSSAKPSPKPLSKPSTKSAQAITAAAKQAPGNQQAPAQELFGLLKQTTRLSEAQTRRLTILLADHPELATTIDGKGPRGRSALFYALYHGHADAVSLIMRTHGASGIAETLKQMFDEILFVEERAVAALRTCISLLSAQDKRTVQQAIQAIYRPGEIEKSVAAKFVEVLEESGLTARANPIPAPASRQAKKRSHAGSTVAKQKTGVVSASATPVQSASSSQSFAETFKIKRREMLTDAIVDGDVTTFTYLLDLSWDTDPALDQDEDGFTPLMQAIAAERIDMMKILLDRPSANQQLMAVTERGVNSLMQAAREGLVEAVKLLLSFPSADAQATAVKNGNMNALMLAAYEGHLEVVKILMALGSAGEQARTLTNFNATAFGLAVQMKHIDVAEFLSDFV